nr:retention module-containing protein [uncultured Desulfobacter sp.]
MAQAGIIKTITGIVNARTPDGQVRQLAVGDVIYENDIIETPAGSELTIELNDGRILNLAENSQIVIDESVVAAVDSQDAVVAEVQELQAALEEGEDIPDNETAAGEEDAGHDYALAYDVGDQTGGDVGSYLFGTAYGDEDDDFPDLDGEEEIVEPEPEPVFIIGSNPQDDDGSTLLDDVEGTSETDYHTINPDGDVQGAIIGQEGADILVGDPGTVAEILDTNYILVMDTSYSMGAPDDDSTTRLEDLQQAVKDFIAELYEKVESASEGSLTINLLPFSSTADASTSAWISFTKTDDTVVVDNNIDDSDPSTDDLDEIYNWIDALKYSGGTNYENALSEADTLVDPYSAKNEVIFISDGIPSNTTAHLTALATLSSHVYSIQAVGINMDSTGKAILDDIDSDNDATSITDTAALSEIISNFIDSDLSPAGSDEIYGNDGDDLIFGDVLNTDGVFDSLTSAGYDLSTIDEPPDGSGWEVFDTLEEELSNWTRADTLQYIQENHEDLAKETVLGTGTEDGDVRDGGDDYIYGGAGDDIIYGQEGDDTIDAGSGDDVVDGGSGFDTLAVTSETELDFSNVSNIESIDLNEDGVDQTLTLSLDQVLSMTDEDNTLQITGEAGDSVTLTGVDSGEWTHDGNGLFTNVADNSIQVSIETVNDGVDIDVNVDNGDSFHV